MNKIYKLLMMLTFSVMLNFNLKAQKNNRCESHELMEAAFKANPSYRIKYDDAEKQLGIAIAKRVQSRNGNGENFTNPVVIPIVFHVVLTAGQQANITNAMILAQFNQLNKDYGGTNADSANIPAAFQAVRGHSQVSFCLAQRTPTNTATNGIDRVISSTVSGGSGGGSDPIKSTAAGGADAWDPTRFINVWLCNFPTGSGLLGYSSFPIGSPENGSGSITQQGVVVLAQSINGGTAAPYNLGRTLTHELGHFFWLRHIWGDGNCANDFPNTAGIDDTPASSGAYFGCAGTAPNVVAVASGCAASPNPPGRMYQNYMDYTDDACMTMFTNGQNLRAEMAINMYMPSLLTSNGCTPPTDFNFGPTTPTTTACPITTAPAVSIPTTVTGTFVTPIIMSSTGAPAGTSISFAPPSVTPGNNVVASLINANTLAPGTYVINITGTAGIIVKNTTITYIVPSSAAITSQPRDTSVCTGTTAQFSAAATGNGVVYQWQSSLVATGPFTNVVGGTGANTATYTTAITTPTTPTTFYRLNVTTTACAGNVNSTVVKLIVNTVASISIQPSPQSVCIPATATFNTAALGTGLSYQWQISTAAVPAFTNISGASSASYSTPIPSVINNGDRYRVNIFSTCSPLTPTTSNDVVLTVNIPVSISQNPIAASGCAGDNYSFNVTALPTTATYQWEVSTNAGLSYTAIPSATSANFPITGASFNLNGNLYRVVVTSIPCGSITTPAVKLTLSNKPSIVLTAPATSSTNASVNQGLFTTISPSNFVGTFNWTKNGATIPNTLTAASILLPVDGIGTYKVSTKDANTGCVSESNIVVIDAEKADNIAKGKLFIYPNPVTNTMEVRFNFPNVGTLGTVLNIFDEKGARVFSKAFTLSNTFGRMKVDMSNVRPATYIAYVMDANGNKLASAKVVKVP